MSKELFLDEFNITGGTQPRASLNEEVIADYTEAMQRGDVFQPVLVVYEATTKTYWLYDGFHRLEAARRAGRKKLDADIRTGTLRDAVLLSCTTNSRHGLRRTNEDKKVAIFRLLADIEWADKPNKDIAAHCRVSLTFVVKWRSDSPESTTRLGQHASRILTEKDEQKQGNEEKLSRPRTQDSPVRQVIRGGKDYEMKVGKIGKKPAVAVREEPALPEPAATTQIQPTRIDLLEALVVALRAYLAKPTQEVLRGLLDALGALDEQAEQNSQTVNGLERGA